MSSLSHEGSRDGNPERASNPTPDLVVPARTDRLEALLAARELVQSNNVEAVATSLRAAGLEESLCKILGRESVVAPAEQALVRHTVARLSENSQATGGSDGEGLDIHARISDWCVRAVTLVAGARGSREGVEFARLSVGLSDRLDDGTITVSDLVSLVKRVVASGVQFEIQPEHVEHARVICARSKEVRNDLSFLEFSRQQALHPTVEQVTAIYDQGNNFIYDASAVIPALADSYSESKRAMIPVLQKFAASARYPDFRTQQEVASVVSRVSEQHRDAAVEICVRILTNPENRKLALGFAAALVQRSPDAEVLSQTLEAVLALDRRAPTGDESDHVEKPVPESTASDLIDGVLLVRDTLRKSPQLLGKFLPHFLKGELAAVSGELYREELHEDRFVEPPLIDVLRSFSRKEYAYSEVPDPAVLKRVGEQYRAMSGLELQLERLPDEKFFTLCAGLKTRLAFQVIDDHLPDAQRIEVLGVLRDAFRRQFGIRPYVTQMLELLLLTDPQELTRGPTTYKGLYGQVRTGEGKSLMLALLAGYDALCGRRVDVITSDRLLAKRDALKFAPFFERFGLSEQHYHYDPAEPFKVRDPVILYTTNESLIFGYLAARLEGEEFFQGRRFDSALVDEADNLCLDLAKEGCRISTKIEPLVPLPVMQQMLHFAQSLTPEQRRGNPSALLERFKAKCPPDLLPALAGVDASVLPVFLGSAAYSFSLRRDVDYVVRDNQVVIVDKLNTGRLQERSQWGAGLHHFVALREGAKMPRIRGLACQMGHPDLLRRYRSMRCISGTFGDDLDRREIGELYTIRGYDFPRHRPSKRVDEEIRLFKTQEERDAAVIERAKELVASGRALLTVSHTVQQSKALATRMRKEGIASALLNDFENRNRLGEAADEFEIIEAAGGSGMATNGTGVTARGADIVVSAPCREAGGLEVIATDFPTNERTEQQVRGRAGRQGNPGSSRVWVTVDDEWFRTISSGHRELLQVLVERDEFGPQHPMTTATLKLVRLYQNVHSAIERRAQHQYARVMQEAQEHYFLACQRFNQAMEVKYPELRQQPGDEPLGNPVLEPVRRQWGAAFEMLGLLKESLLNGDSGLGIDEHRALPPSVFFPRISAALPELFGFSLETISECPEEQRLFRSALKVELQDMDLELRRAEEKLRKVSAETLRAATDPIKRQIDTWFQALRTQYIVGSERPPERKARARSGPRSHKSKGSEAGTRPLVTDEIEDAFDKMEGLD